jgi:hypothetical protein
MRDVSAFLGVQVHKDTSSKTIHLSQPGLIEQVITDVGFDQFSKGRDTPVDTILYADSEGPARQETWNYRSIIGELNYIVNNTRPDITMVVHQCAHFSATLKALHKVELYDNILSQTGFIINFCECQITWCSKLQTEIAVSTESEYVALSMAT